MKTKIFLLFAAMVMLSGVVSAQESGALSLANISVSPNPVLAGGSATIRFQLYSSFNFYLFNVNLQPTGSYPILNVSPQNSYHISQIAPGFNASYHNYTIAIPNTTPSGVYTVTFAATYYVLSAQGIDVATSSMPVSFYVQNKPSIQLVISNAQPSALYSGYNQTIDLGIENNGYGTARNVSVVVAAGQDTTILSSLTNFFISNLTRGQVVEEPILISARNTSNAQLLANINYYSAGFGQRFSSSQDLSLSVAPAAQFIVSSNGGNIAPGATDVPVSFVITNTGTSDAGQMQLNLQTTYPITPVASTAYISNLPQGDSVNVTFLVDVDSTGVPGNYPVTVYEQWKQPNGATSQQFSGSNNYYVGVGSTGSGTLLIAAVVIVIVVAGVLVYRFVIKGTKSKSKK